jgi:hypothetical protein
MADVEDDADHVRPEADLFASNVANASPGSGSLAAGQTVAGDVTFQVPASETTFGCCGLQTRWATPSTSP